MPHVRGSKIANKNYVERMDDPLQKPEFLETVNPVTVVNAQFSRFLRRTKISTVNDPVAVVLVGAWAGAGPEKPSPGTTGNGHRLSGYFLLFLGLGQKLRDLGVDGAEDSEYCLYRI